MPELAAATEWTNVQSLKLSKPVTWFGQMTDDSGNGVPDNVILAWAVHVANDFVDSFVRLRPGLPVTEIKAALMLHANNVAKYVIAQRRGRIDDDVKMGWDDANAYLKAIVSGEISIGADDSVSAIEGEIQGNKTEDDLDADIEGMAYVV
jgi:phage gp36-like protein